jgi:hypothetical protein
MPENIDLSAVVTGEPYAAVADAAIRTDELARVSTALVDSLPPARAGVKRLFLCRHGQTELNRLGKMQVPYGKTSLVLDISGLS